MKTMIEKPVPIPMRAALATQAELERLPCVRRIPRSVGMFEASLAASSTRCDAWERFA